MPADRYIAEDGSVRWSIHGDGLAADIPDAMYQGIQRHADEIREIARRKELGHPLFNRPTADSRLMLVGRPQYDMLAKSMGWRRDPAIAPLPIPSPWRHDNGQAVGEAKHARAWGFPKTWLCLAVGRLFCNTTRGATHHAR